MIGISGEGDEEDGAETETGSGGWCCKTFALRLLYMPLTVGNTPSCLGQSFATISVDAPEMYCRRNVEVLEGFAKETAQTLLEATKHGAVCQLNFTEDGCLRS